MTPPTKPRFARRPRVALALFATLILAATVTQAQSRWQIRAFGAYGNAGSGYELAAGDEFIRVNTDKLSGWGLALDYRFSSRFALELGYLDSNIDSDAQVSLSGIDDADRFDIGFNPITLGLGFNLLPGRDLDLVLSPQLAWINFGNPTLNLSEIGEVAELTLDDEVSWGIGLRLDVPLGKWLINAGVDYYDATAKVTNPDIEPDIRITVDPWIFKLGAGYRF